MPNKMGVASRFHSRKYDGASAHWRRTAMQSCVSLYCIVLMFNGAPRYQKRVLSRSLERALSIYIYIQLDLCSICIIYRGRYASCIWIWVEHVPIQWLQSGTISELWSLVDRVPARLPPSTLEPARIPPRDLEQAR
jgi:hypothetical protein